MAHGQTCVNTREHKELALGWDQESAPPDNIQGRT
jgi:hypothetical protein